MKRLLITGASSGIGQALALHAAEQGYQVIACGRNPDKLAQLAKHQHIQTVTFDVSDESATRKALENIEADIAVINAGTCEYVDASAMEPDMFRRVFEANFFGAVNTTAALLPNLCRGSQLVFVDSLARLLPFTRSEAYGASKAALHYFAKSLEVDLFTKGVKVQTISPGFVATPLTDKNDFAMPMKVSAETAAITMLAAIEKQQHSLYFPTLFAAIIRFMSWLPAVWQRKMCISMKNKNQQKRLQADA